MKYFLCAFLQAYKPRTWLVDRDHRRTRPKDLEKGDETILPTSWLCTIFPRSPNATNRLITEQSALAL